MSLPFVVRYSFVKKYFAFSIWIFFIRCATKHKYFKEIYDFLKDQIDIYFRNEAEFVKLLIRLQAIGEGDANYHKNDKKLLISLFLIRLQASSGGDAWLP